MNDFDSDTSPEMQALESQLARLEPSHSLSPTDLAQMMYRCGFAAAKANPVVTCIDSVTNARRRVDRSWRAFGWGHLSGLATGIAALWLWSAVLSVSDPSIPMMDHAIASAPPAAEALTAGPAVVSEPASRDEADSAARQPVAALSTLRPSWWAPVQSRALSKPDRIGVTALDQDILSLAARNTWASVLAPAAPNAAAATQDRTRGAENADVLRAFPHIPESLNDLL